MRTEPTFKIYNEINKKVAPVFVAVGNHEFDNGWEYLHCINTTKSEKCQTKNYRPDDEIYQHRSTEEKIRYSLLGSNIAKKDKQTKQESSFLPSSPLYETFLTNEGVKIGVFGLTTPTTKTTSDPTNTDDKKVKILFQKPKEITKKVIEKTRGKVDFLILLSHLGSSSKGHTEYEDSAEIIYDNFPEVDLIVDGHSHNNFSLKGDKEHPLWIRSTSYSRNLKRLVIDFCFQGSYWNYKFKEYKGKQFQDMKYYDVKKELKNYVPDEVINKEEEILHSYSQIINKIFNQEILEGIKFDLKNLKYKAKDFPLGNLITDAFHWWSKQKAEEFGLEPSRVKFALQNTGGIRESLNPDRAHNGLIILKDIYNVLPFDTNEIYLVQQTGKEIRNLLTRSLNNSHGLVVSAEGNDNLVIYYKKMGKSREVFKIDFNNETIEDEKLYYFGLTSFIYNGGDGYQIIKQHSGLKNTHEAMFSAVAKYVKWLGSTTFNKKYQVYKQHWFYTKILDFFR